MIDWEIEYQLLKTSFSRGILKNQNHKKITKTWKEEGH